MRGALTGWLLLSLLSAMPALGAERRCTSAAIALLQEHVPEGHRIVASTDDEAFFARWLDCSSPPLFDVDVALHESVHLAGGRIPDSPHTYTLVRLGGASLEVDATRILFPRSEIGTYLEPPERGGYYQTYLTGPSGQQDILLVLDELNAYVHSLDALHRLTEAHPMEPGARTSARDGVAVFMYYLQLMVRHADAAHPQDAQRIREPDLATAIATVWRDAEQVLSRTCALPHLGIDDGWYLLRVYEPGNAAVMTSVLPGLAPGLPPTCGSVLAEARPPVPGSFQDTTTATLKQQVALPSEVRVTVNGEVLTLDELEALASKDPLYRQVLQDVRAQLSSTYPPGQP